MNRKSSSSGQPQSVQGGSGGSQHQGSGAGQQPGGSQQGGSGSYDGGKKEGFFLPRGEPSRLGRGGGPGRAPGGRGPTPAHYGPPPSGTKPVFNPLTTNKDEDANDSSSEEKKRSVITGILKRSEL